MTQRIIFLDVDGPLIPTPLYYLDPNVSMRRSIFSTTAVGLVVKLARDAGAKIVFNSTHNDHDYRDALTANVRTLRADAIRHKIPAELIHEDWRTGFPNRIQRKFSEASGPVRLRAIEEWISRNGETEWIVFDDEPIASDRAIVVNFDHGITVDDYLKARELFGLSTPSIWTP